MDQSQRLLDRLQGPSREFLQLGATLLPLRNSLLISFSPLQQIVGSYVGNRQDAVEALDFALRGKVVPQIAIEPLENLRSVYERMEKGQVSGRIVLKT